MEVVSDASKYCLFLVRESSDGPAPKIVEGAWKGTLLAGKKEDSGVYVTDLAPSLVALSYFQNNPVLAQEAVRWYLSEAMPRGLNKLLFDPDKVEPITEITQNHYNTFLDWLHTISIDPLP